MDPSELRERDVTAVVVDVVGSTEMKSKYGQAAVAELVFRLYSQVIGIVDKAGLASPDRKFTGDGAVIVWRHDDRAVRAGRAVTLAGMLLEQVELMNLQAKPPPPFRIRIGVATGLCHVDISRDEYSGLTVDLAARLCSAAQVDTALVDAQTADALLSDDAFLDLSRVDRVIDLKGIPKSVSDAGFWTLRSQRLFSPEAVVSAGPGLVGLYEERGSLGRDFSPARIIHRAAPRTEVLVAGRSLVAWTQYGAEMLAAAKERGVRFRFIVSGDEDVSILGKNQQEAVKKDVRRAVPFF